MASAKKATKKSKKRERLDRKFYENELERLQIELVKLQEWVKATGAKIVVVFEGRDAAGKGGVIKRITERVSPRVFRVVALPAPSDREKTQWYFQRYISHLPAAGEVVLLDRSWYNRAGVERVMDFCTDEQYIDFLQATPNFERELIQSGIILIKYWLTVSNQEQKRRFEQRIEDPRKQWKLSPMDVEARHLWYEYAKARDVMFKATDNRWSPWFIVDSNDKRRARLNTISHLLNQVPYEEVDQDTVKLPRRGRKNAYDDEAALEGRKFVPELF